MHEPKTRRAPQVRFVYLGLGFSWGLLSFQITPKQEHKNESNGFFVYVGKMKQP